MLKWKNNSSKNVKQLEINVYQLSLSEEWPVSGFSFQWQYIIKGKGYEN